MRHSLWLAAIIGFAACDAQQPGGQRENRGPLPSVEIGRGKDKGPATPGPNIGSQSGTGVNADPGGGGISAFPVLVDPYGTPKVPAQQLVAVVTGTAANPGVRGEVRFSVTGPDLHVTSSVTGLPQGAHAHHVHLFGDCSTAESAGPHFDFERGSGGPAPAITGDLGNLASAASGPATADRTIKALDLGSLVGRAVVIHAGANDSSKGPDGGAGEPIACGVIGIVGHGGGTGPIPGTGAPAVNAENPGQVRNPPAPGVAPPASVPSPPGTAPGQPASQPAGQAPAGQPGGQAPSTPPQPR